MSALDHRIVAYFGGDERPADSWTLLNATDQRWISRIALSGGDDPGVTSYDALQRLGGDDRRRRLRALEDWYKAWPYVRTTQVRAVEGHLIQMPEPRPGADDELLDVPVITGPPGTGKTALMKRAAVRALCTAAWDRRLEGPVKGRANELFQPDWRPVIFHSTDGNPHVKTFFSHLCDELSVPATRDPQAAFHKAVLRHGVQYVFIDEVQMINFDGQYGMYLHNALKAIQNMNVRVVLAGHNVRHLLVDRKTAAQNATQTQSIARWAFHDLERYGHESKTDITEWRGLLRGLEGHVRLAGHEAGEPVFSEQFEEHLWVSTLGYVNAVAALVTGICLAATRTPNQRITADIIDRTRLNERVARGRDLRLQGWRAGKLRWSTDAIAAA